MGGGAIMLLALNYVNDTSAPLAAQTPPSQSASASGVAPALNGDSKSILVEDASAVMICLPTRISLEGRLHVPASVQARVCTVLATMCQNCRPVQRHLLSLNAHLPLLALLEDTRADKPDVQTLRLLLCALTALSCNSFAYVFFISWLSRSFLIACSIVFHSSSSRSA